MALSLSKGGNLSLTKTDPTLSKIIVGLGWDHAPLTVPSLTWTLARSC